MTKRLLRSTDAIGRTVNTLFSLSRVTDNAPFRDVINCNNGFYTIRRYYHYTQCTHTILPRIAANPKIVRISFSRNFKTVERWTFYLTPDRICQKNKKKKNSRKQYKLNFFSTTDSNFSTNAFDNMVVVELQMSPGDEVSVFYIKPFPGDKLKVRHCPRLSFSPLNVSAISKYCYDTNIVWHKIRNV